MQDHPVLGQLALGYAPVIDRQRRVSALRLTVFPEPPGATPDAAALLTVLQSVWPAPAEPAKPRVVLNLAGESLLQATMAARPPRHLLLEMPAFIAAEPATAPLLLQLRKSGVTLGLKGVPRAPLPPELLACFQLCVLGPEEDRRAVIANEGSARNIETAQAGVSNVAEMEAAFSRGATHVTGWPWDAEPEPSAGRGSVPSDVGTVMDLINGVDREEPVGKLEPILRRDPTLAFRLMRYLNSPAFGLPVEVNSFGHALMLLGYKRLKRWLALLLVSSAKGANSQVQVFAAIRRGLLMEELAGDFGNAESRGEMFICGVFSMLPLLLQQPMAELLRSVPVPDAVQQALRGEGGPYGDYLQLVLAIESASHTDIREGWEKLMLGPAAVNRAILKALQSASELET